MAAIGLCTLIVTLLAYLDNKKLKEKQLEVLELDKKIKDQQLNK
jgi:hypothetical protein